MKNLYLLFMACALFLLAVAWPIAAKAQPRGQALGFVALAAWPSFLPTAMAVGLMAALRHRPALEKLAAILVATGLRVGLALGGGFLSYYLNPRLQERPMAYVGWFLGFYLLTLVVESALWLRETRPADALDGDA